MPHNVGTPQNDRVDASLTPETIRYHRCAGQDALLGTTTAKVLFGGEGADFLYADDRRDRLFGGIRADLACGGAILSGGRTILTLYGGTVITWRSFTDLDALADQISFAFPSEPHVPTLHRMPSCAPLPS